MLCWFYRLSISNSYDTGKPVTRMTKKHLEKCESCRHFYNVTDLMENQLPLEAKLVNKTHPSQSDEQFIQGIFESKINHVPIMPIKIKIRPIAMAAGIAIVFFISFFFLQSNQEVEDTKQFNRTITELSGFVNIKKGTDFARIIEEPIKNEFENIVGDTKTIAQFLLTCIDINIDATENYKDITEDNTNSQD